MPKLVDLYAAKTIQFEAVAPLLGSMAIPQGRRQ